MMAQVFSAFLPSYEYIPDIEPHVFGDRLYLYGSHDRFGGNRFCLNDYVVWSAPLNDLSDWCFEGEIYKKNQDPANTSGKLALYAPDVAKGPDGRYYLYYCLADYPQIGVAVCDDPCGKFEFLDYIHDGAGNIIGRREVDTLPFDPAVLVDDDSRIWLYFGNGPMKAAYDKNRKKASVYVELEADMVTVKTKSMRLIPTLHDSEGTGFEGHEFFEASSMRKFGSRYYFIYSSIQSHELCYAISNRPDGGFSYGGTLISNGDIRPEDGVRIGFNSKANPLIHNYIGNNHGSLLELNGGYYIFYHRQTNRNMFSRQACAEKIELLPNGAFRQAEITSCGLNDGSLEGKGRYEARIACHLFSKQGALFSVHPLVQNKKHPAFTQHGVDRESDPNQYIENMRDGATAGFRYFDFQNTRKITVTSRGKGEGKLVARDGIDGKVVATIPVKSMREWGTSEAPMEIENGIHPLYLTYEGKNSIDFLDFMLE